MTKEELEKYTELNNIMISDAKRVARFFVKLSESYEFIDEWSYDGEDVIGRGLETWNYGGHEEHYISFDGKWLCASDEELKSYVKEELKKREKAKKAVAKLRHAEKENVIELNMSV